MVWRVNKNVGLLSKWPMHNNRFVLPHEIKPQKCHPQDVEDNIFTSKTCNLTRHKKAYRLETAFYALSWRREIFPWAYFVYFCAFIPKLPLVLLFRLWLV